MLRKGNMAQSAMRSIPRAGTQTVVRLEDVRTPSGRNSLCQGPDASKDRMFGEQLDVSLEEMK